MTYKTILIALFLYLPFSAISQKLIWVHHDLVEKNSPNWRYNQDTALFYASEKITGLVYYPTADPEQPTLALTVQNELGKKNTATFSLKKVALDQFNWPPSILKWQRYLIKSPHWYSFEITPNLDVVNAYDAVQFLEVIAQTAAKNGNATFTYNVAGKYTTNSCVINFRREQGFFSPLWTKLNRYQKIIQKKKSVEQQQASLVEQCQPHGFSQVQAWGNQVSGLNKDLEASDLDIFKAVENLKIITETIPKSVSPYLKRELRALFLLDIDILEMPKGSDKTKKLNQKNDLVKQLSLYPELQSILTTYNRSTGAATDHKKTEQQQQKELQDIIKKYRPYQTTYETHQALQLELNVLNSMLIQFD